MANGTLARDGHSIPTDDIVHYTARIIGMAAEDSEKIEFAIAKLPESLQPAVRNWFERLATQDDGALQRLESCQFDLNGLIRLLACSEYAAGVLLQQWDWFLSVVESGHPLEPPARTDLEAQFADLLQQADDKVAFTRGLRQLRHQTLVRILWFDLVAGGLLQRTLTSLSDLADVAIAAAVDFATRQAVSRYGELQADGERIPLVVIAMGKLGGRELNFSSDIDLVFAYPTDGMTDGAAPVSAHEFFTRVVRQVAALLEEATADGFVYRVDTRLRPFGDSGPPVVSFAGLENYLLQHGRSWERYAYIKARIIVPPDSSDLAQELKTTVINPFVYRRYLDYGVFESLREMKALVAAQVRKREMTDNIKLGPGGIREIEFIVQALQLVRGGSIAPLRTTQLRAALSAAAAGHDMTDDVADLLLDAYEFLRRVENRIQAVRDRQTHDLPTDAPEQTRLAYAMGLPSWSELESRLNAVRASVSEQFSTIAFRDADESVQPSEFAELWSARAGQSDWQEVFERRGYAEPESVAKSIASFAALPSTRRTDAVAAKRLRQFIPTVLRLLAAVSQPATVLDRVLNIVDKVLRRSAYLALLNENRVVLERLVDLCATSVYLAREVAHFPALLDELIDARIFDAVPDADEFRSDLARRIGVVDPRDTERQLAVLAEFKRATLFRLAIADFNGKIPVMQVSDRLTDIAELILSHALMLARADLVSRNGEPRYVQDGQAFSADLGVVAYGKLGGLELSYGSDLDIVFLHDSRGEQQQTDGARPLDNGMFFGRLAQRLVHFLTTQTASGALYEIDTRLRPSGRAGLLVTSIDAFERYQEENAWTWEHQALLRGRVVAGSAIVAREFERIRSHTLRKRVRRDELRSDVTRMRKKMRDNLDKTAAGFFDLKQGAGGIADIEFLVQYLVLLNADAHPAVIHYTDNIRQLGTLAAADCLTEDDSRRLQQAYRSLRARTHRQALDEQPARSAADEFMAQRQFVQALWQRELGDDE
jgi:glutamate-ammonia-ligase adenylyltransferase